LQKKHHGSNNNKTETEKKHSRQNKAQKAIESGTMAERPPDRRYDNCGYASRITITTMQTTTTTKKATAKKAVKPKKLSKLGEWMRSHPIGDMIIYDKSVLYN
jgi:hypothetical protein